MSEVERFIGEIISIYCVSIEKHANLHWIVSNLLQKM